jgi:antitoxin CptB
MSEAGTVLERTPAARHAQALERLRWRSRRGLLELDIVLERFWARGAEMDEGDAAALERLLALPDNDLLDLVMGRADTTETYLQPMLHRLRTV